MLNFITIIIVSCHAFFLITGLTGSLFILAVQFLDWQKKHQLGPVDLIIVSIKLINLFLQGSFAFNEICVFLFVEFLVQVWVVNPLVVIMTSLAFSSLWCSTTLCFYYYVKINNLNGTVFYKLKANLPVIIPWLLVFSNIISWAIGLPAYWDIYRPTDNATDEPLSNHLTFESKCGCMFSVFVGLSCIPFAIILFTAGGIIKSLYKHMTQIKKNNEGVKRGQLSAHISAARTVTSLLILYLIFYGTLNILFSETQDIGSVIYIVSCIVASSFPTANALILIFGNRKLSNKLRYVLGVKIVSSNSEISVTT